MTHLSKYVSEFNLQLNDTKFSILIRNFAHVFVYLKYEKFNILNRCSTYTKVSRKNIFQMQVVGVGAFL